MPDFREQSPTQDMSRTNFVLDFVLMLIFLRFCSVFLLMFFGIETLLDIVSDGTEEEIATQSKDVCCVRHMVHDYAVCIVLIAI